MTWLHVLFYASCSHPVLRDLHLTTEEPLPSTHQTVPGSGAGADAGADVDDIVHIHGDAHDDDDHGTLFTHIAGSISH